MVYNGLNRTSKDVSGGPATAGPGGPIHSPVSQGEEDERLIANLLANNPEAVARIAAWARTVATFHAWGFDTPEDIVQETLLALLRNLRDGRVVGGDLRAYVRRIAKNICVSSYRRVRRRGIHLPLDDQLPAPAVTLGGANLERSVMARRILENLDVVCRRLIILAYYHGLSRREIGGRLGISEAAAKVRLFRCLEKAREQRAGI